MPTEQSVVYAVLNVDFSGLPALARSATHIAHACRLTLGMMATRSDALDIAAIFQGVSFRLQDLQLNLSLPYVACGRERGFPVDGRSGAHLPKYGQPAFRTDERNAGVGNAYESLSRRPGRGDIVHADEGG